MTDETKQAFEEYPQLAEKLLHAAKNWSTNDTWSATLGEINKVCRENVALQQKLQAAEKGLKAIQTEIESCLSYRSFISHRECLEIIALATQETLDIINPSH